MQNLRSVDPAANPYLALAVILKAGLGGIKDKLELPAPVNENIYEMTREEREAVGVEDLPSTLYTSLKALRRIHSCRMRWAVIFTDSSEIIRWKLDVPPTSFRLEIQQYLNQY